MRVVNLSSHPFVNERPVRRAAALLWVVAAVLIALNIFNYWTYWLDSAEIRGDLGEVRKTVADSRKTYEDLRKEVSNISLDRLNEKTVFLNQLIELRTFPWSQLFSDLEEVLSPHYDIQLRSVQPQQKKEKAQLSTKTSSRRRDQRRGQRAKTSPPPTVSDPASPKPKEVLLQLRGVSKSSEAIYGLVDTLFAHPAFLDPDLRGEAQDDKVRLTSFDIGVVYLTHTSEEAPEENREDLLADGSPAVADGSPAVDDTSEQRASAQLSTPQPGDTPANRDAKASPPAGAAPSVSNLQEAPSPVSTSTKGAPSRRVTPPQQASPQQASPQQALPRRALPRRAPPPRQATPRQAPPQANAPRPPVAQRNAGRPPDSRRATPPQPLRPRQVPPPSARTPPAPPPQPNFDSEVASSTPRLRGGGA